MLGSPSRYRIYGGIENYLKSTFEFARASWHRGADVERLEEILCKTLNSPVAAAMPLARVGIYLAIKNLIRPGQAVLMSPYTIADVVNMVIAAGGRPRFVDVEPDTGNMDPAELKRRMSRDCGVILVTHLHGITASIEEITSIARESGVPLIEDTAQSLGARAGGVATGTFGDVGVFSFGTYKNVNSWYGGAIVAKDRALIATIKEQMQSWPAFSDKKVYEKLSRSVMIATLCWNPVFRTLVHRIFRHGFLHDVDSINKIVAIELDTARHDTLPSWYRSRLTPGQARRVIEQWSRIDSHSAARIEYARTYDKEVTIGAGIRKPPAPMESRHVFTYYPLLARNRQNLLKWLMYFRRDIAAQHLKNCAHLESFKEFYHHCPVADEVARSIVLLPTYPGYGIDAVRENAAIVRWYVEQDAPEFSMESARQLARSHGPALITHGR